MWANNDSNRSRFRVVEPKRNLFLYLLAGTGYMLLTPITRKIVSLRLLKIYLNSCLPAASCHELMSQSSQSRPSNCLVLFTGQINKTILQIGGDSVKSMQGLTYKS